MSGPTHDRDTAVQTLCRDLKLPGVLRHYRNGIVPTDPKDYLRESLEAERTSRREKRLKNLLKGARLPYARTLSEYDFLRLPSLPKEQILSLAQGDFLRRRENLVLLGNSGTGKTHVAIGVAASCIAAGYAVRFTTALTLAQELLLAQDEHRLPRVLKSYDRYDLVVVDELGYLGRGAVREKERLHHHKPGVRPLGRGLRGRHPDGGPPGPPDPPRTHLCLQGGILSVCSAQRQDNDRLGGIHQARGTGVGAFSRITLGAFSVDENTRRERAAARK